MSASEQILLGTCAFTASGWNGAFYPKGMKSTDYLTFYSELRYRGSGLNFLRLPHPEDSSELVRKDGAWIHFLRQGAAVDHARENLG
jgi:uncharacterized protein YecE (DUF72 family)